MKPAPRPIWPAVLLLATGLALLYAGALGTGFLNDDHLFLEQARTRPLGASLTTLGPLGNYVRPVSRQLWFAVLTPMAGGNPRVFHAADALVFAGALALLADLLAVFAPPIGVLAGVVYLALLPSTRVLLMWVSCSQDLLALLFTLAALACFRRHRDGWAVALHLLAVFSKEAALPFPVAALAWARLVDREPWPRALRRVTPMTAVTAAWVVATLVIRARAPHVAATLSFAPMNFLAAMVHGVQSLVGLDTPEGWAHPFAHLPYAPAALVALALGGAWLAWPARRAAVGASDPGGAVGGRPAGAGADPTPAAEMPSATGAGTRPGARIVVPFALVWLMSFALVTGPVASTWSGYFYTLAAVGAALLVALAARALTPLGWTIAVALALWSHGVAVETRAFAVAENPWGWTSHLNAAYFRRAAALTDTLARQLVAREPHPAPGTRFFFATLPPWAGFQMGNGALIRATYRDTSLRSYFYSQFSDSSAGWAPVRVLYWDGRTLGPLYARASEPWFEVGGDLLLFDRPAGAAHAFHRGLAAGGETRFDLLYWLGWAELFQGRRGDAERAWLDAGLHDDSTAWFNSMRLVRLDLEDRRDTLAARRALADAIMAGPGQPLPHALLGQLMMRTNPKYGLLELSVATWLRPGDRDSQRALAIGFAVQRLDAQAGVLRAGLAAIDPGWRRDTTLAKVARVLDERSLEHVKVARF
ncbi:MAG: hypothetical protein ACHQ52_10270 [Candidatus Eisenbacteria bacterium]